MSTAPQDGFPMHIRRWGVRGHRRPTRVRLQRPPTISIQGQGKAAAVARAAMRRAHVVPRARCAAESLAEDAGALAQVPQAFLVVLLLRLAVLSGGLRRIA